MSFLIYDNVDAGLVEACRVLRKYGVQQDSRNGPVLRMPKPIILNHLRPEARVSLLPERNANPFFHFMEAIWMLAGENSLSPLLRYNGQMASYSDDGKTLRGTAYGYKWRGHFGYDQLALAIQRLRENREDRRIVMTMWDPSAEWRDPTSRDLSCNLQVILNVVRRGGADELDMTVTNRSNDLVWGALGSNVFHFSFTQEFIALHAGLKLGQLFQFSANLHGYLENPVFKAVYEVAGATEESIHETLPPYPKGIGTMTALELADDTTVLRRFLYEGDPSDSYYLKKVGVPLYEAYRLFKLRGERGVGRDREKVLDLAISIAGECADPHLAEAGRRWLGRRMERARSPAADAPFEESGGSRRYASPFKEKFGEELHD